MKAERRHELQENSLARFIDNLPVMLRLYADRILLAVVLVLLVVVLIRWRMNQTEARANQTANDLAEAKASVTRLQRMPMIGLAAIAENRHNWDEAAKLYNQIKNSDVEKMYKDLADARLKLLPDIQAPVLLGSLTTKPADLEPASQPATQSTSLPATQPVQ